MAGIQHLNSKIGYSVDILAKLLMIYYRCYLLLTLQIPGW
ncbi:hypothetical protein NSP_8430 [Nodularia spumigena CCY9414]|nr:hypothetical protein NSP_8430 [Nodularia spumigena CCY9414]